MKTTTKILICTTIFSWCISIIAFGIDYKDNEISQNNNIEISTDSTHISISPNITHIDIWYDADSHSYMTHKITLTPTHDKKPGIYIPDKLKDCISLKTTKDTLVIKIKIPYETEYSYSELARACTHIYADSIKSIHNHTGNNVIIYGITSDSFSILDGRSEINNCKINEVLIDKNADVSFINSEILKYTIIGNERNWKTNNHTIAEEISYN